MKVYFISGLGADERVFAFLKLDGQEKVFIQWVPPIQDETLGAYSTRLIAQIDLKEEVILIGVSFGGVVAQEIAKIIPCKKVIIISSIKSHRELDWQLRVVRRFRLHKIFSANLLVTANLITAKYYYSITSEDELQLLRKIILDTDRQFMVWAIDAIINWKNLEHSRNIIHIHGTDDKIFPINKINNCIKIEKGGHLMIVSLSEQVERTILQALSCA
jgi:pimeloyl-ACP methyl ester carboxylesterase